MSRSRSTKKERAEEAWEQVLEEVDKTRRWRECKGMKPATDTSEFCGAPNTTLWLLERLALHALGRKR